MQKYTHILFSYKITLYGITLILSFTLLKSPWLLVPDCTHIHVLSRSVHLCPAARFLCTHKSFYRYNFLETGTCIQVLTFNSWIIIPDTTNRQPPCDHFPQPGITASHQQHSGRKQDHRNFRYVHFVTKWFMCIHVLYLH